MIDISDYAIPITGTMSEEAGKHVEESSLRKEIDGSAEVEAETRGWITDVANICAPLSAEAIQEVTVRADKDIFRGIKPVAHDKVPHVIFALGAPGSGKSTLSRVLANKMKLYPEEQYVDLDFDTLIKYHPRYDQVMNIRDVHGEPTGFGYAFGFIKCSYDTDITGSKLFTKIVEEKYNAIIHTHDMHDLVWARQHQYRVSLLYVITDLKTAQKRAEDRAMKIGRFLAFSRSVQNKHIERMYTRYRNMVPWYGLWANDVFIVNNNVDGKTLTADDIEPVETDDAAIAEEMLKVATDVEKVFESLIGRRSRRVAPIDQPEPGEKKERHL